MNQTSDIELKKAALLIVKLLLRSREGKIVWKNNYAEKMLAASLGDVSNTNQYTADLDDGIQAILTKDSRQLGFELTAPLANKALEQASSPSYLVSMLIGENPNKVLKISLPHSEGNTADATPESTIYRDLQELIELAENPKAVSNDLRYNQAMSFLDNLDKMTA